MTPRRSSGAKRTNAVPREPARADEPQAALRQPSPLRRELAAITWLLFALFLAGAMALHGVSVVRAGGADVRSSFGWIGATLVGPLVAMFGWAAAALMPLAPAVHGLRHFGRLGERADRSWLVFLLGSALLVPIAFGLASWSGVPGEIHPLTGIWGALIAHYMMRVVGSAGAWIAWLLLMSGLTATTLAWNPIRMLVGRRTARQPVGAPEPAGGLTLAERLEPPPEDLPAMDVAFIHVPVQPETRPPAEVKRRERTAKPERGTAASVGAVAGLAHSHELTSDDDELPPIDLLSPSSGKGAELRDDQLRAMGEKLVEALRTFRVESRLQDWRSGPVVTQFRVVPAEGVKVRQIANLANDLALAMKAQSIRIVAPVPGIGAVGIEIPNPERHVVALRDLFDAADFKNVRAVLPIALGKDLEGQPVVTDLGQMPHLLIAGATGSGKSVCINTIITGLVYRHTPKTLRFVLIDPKMVELNMYNALPHLRHKVVTDNRDAAAALRWAGTEMEDRYKLLAENGARNLQEFNRKVHEGVKLRMPRDPNVAFENSEYTGGIKPYIIVIIDELADLMMTVQGEVETPLAKLAQKARAIGIHLILATQRPSVNVITGLIKANFPSRIAFRVASQVDSRTILDGIGAESLLGYGDMLFLPPAKAEPARIQGAYISSEDTERLMSWYDDRKAARQQARETMGIGPIQPTGEEDILEVVRKREVLESGAGDGDGGDSGDRDRLFREAAEVVIQHQQGSTSLLQRRLRVGYGRAARIVDQLHEAGVLGPPDGSKPRDVLMGFEELDRVCPK